MRQDGEPQRAWKRADGADVSGLVFELNRREMRDLETCRQVWESEGDPLALCEAIRQSDLPDWLASSLLFVVSDGAFEREILGRRRLWRDRERHSIDAVLAAQTAALRANPNVSREHAFTWELSFMGANILASERYENVPKLSRSGVKRAYERVRRGIARRWRYYRARPGMAERLDEARVYMRSVIKASLETS